MPGKKMKGTSRPRRQTQQTEGTAFVSTPDDPNYLLLFLCTYFRYEIVNGEIIFHENILPIPEFPEDVKQWMQTC